MMFKIITVVYNDDYLPYLKAFYNSVRSVYGDAVEIHLAYANLKKSPAYIKNKHKFVMGKKVRSAAAKVNLWADMIEKDLGDRLLFIDCDTIMIKPIDDYFESDFDIGYTVKTFEDENLQWPLNAGVMLIKNVEAARKFFRFWRSETNKIMSDGKLKAIASAAWGACDQAVLGENTDYEGVKFKAFRCCELNECRCVPITDDTHIIHLKGRWHRVIAGEGWSKYRPKSKCKEMYELWKSYAK